MATKITIVIQIDEDKKMKESLWVVVCPTCQFERQVSYAQAWNVRNGRNSNCLKCASLLNESKERIKSLHGTPWNKGKRYSRKSSLKHKRMMELYNDFVKPAHTPETKDKMRLAKLGKTGVDANNWQGGLVRENARLRGQNKYKQLKGYILSRDNYACILCASTTNLEVDHIKEWCNYPELRYEPSNLRTLCKECHKQTNNYMGRAAKLRKEMAYGY